MLLATLGGALGASAVWLQATPSASGVLSGMLSGLINPLATLAAAFVGAHYAFRLQNEERQRAVAHNKAAAVNKAIVAVLWRYNKLVSIERQFITPYRDHPVRCFKIRPTIGLSIKAPTFDMDSLMFLVDAEDRNILFEVHIQLERFDTTLAAIEARSLLHLNVVQPALARAGVLDGVEYDADVFVAAIGQPTSAHLKRITDDIVAHMNQDSRALFELADRLRTVGLTVLPGSKLIRVERIEPSDRPYHQF